MSYEKVEQAKKTIIGTKQTVKAIKSGVVKEVVIAKDAEKRFIDPVIGEAERNGIPVSYVESREKLGRSCGIQVGTVVVAITV